MNNSLSLTHTHTRAQIISLFFDFLPVSSVLRSLPPSPLLHIFAHNYSFTGAKGFSLTHSAELKPGASKLCTTAHKKLDIAALGHPVEGRVTIIEILFLLITSFMHESVVKVREDGMFLSDNNAQLPISEKGAQFQSSLEEMLCFFFLS